MWNPDADPDDEDDWAPDWFTPWVYPLGLILVGFLVLVLTLSGWRP